MTNLDELRAQIVEGGAIRRAGHTRTTTVDPVRPPRLDEIRARIAEGGTFPRTKPLRKWPPRKGSGLVVRHPFDW
jgi:hypothetical protein